MMNTLTSLGACRRGLRIAGAAAIALGAISGCAQARHIEPEPPAVESPAGIPRPPFRFSAADEQLLDEIQRGAFLFLWHAVSPDTGMVYDRTSKRVVSVAGVGFQLSGIPVGVERGWVSRAAAEERALLILRALANNPDNRKEGLFFHYLDDRTAGPGLEGYEHTVSTIDSALLFAGIITASSYFGGEVAQIGNRLIDEANWRFFVLEETEKPYEAGYISLGWNPTKRDDPTGPGTLLPYVWADAGDEHRLVTFLAVAATKPENRVDPSLYYRLRRSLGTDDEGRVLSWFPWSGALFTNFFAHCWIDYSRLGPDQPSKFGQQHRASVDWWENSRRSALFHRQRAIANPRNLPTFGPDAWGLSASDAPQGYAVPGIYPKPIPNPDGRAEFDYPTFRPKDDYGDGTIAPYAAGSSIMFEPALAMSALRHYRNLKATDGTPLVWREPDPTGREFGFRDAFNVKPEWTAPDYVAIDQGPLLLAIENARTGRVWKWFRAHSSVTMGEQRLGFGDITRPKSE